MSLCDVVLRGRMPLTQGLADISRHCSAQAGSISRSWARAGGSHGSLSFVLDMFELQKKSHPNSTRVGRLHGVNECYFTAMTDRTRTASFSHSPAWMCPQPPCAAG